jgi:hypothetical protein
MAILSGTDKSLSSSFSLSISPRVAIENVAS